MGYVAEEGRAKIPATGWKTFRAGIYDAYNTLQAQRFEVADRIEGQLKRHSWSTWKGLTSHECFHRAWDYVLTGYSSQDPVCLDESSKDYIFQQMYPPEKGKTVPRKYWISPQKQRFAPINTSAREIIVGRLRIEFNFPANTVRWIIGPDLTDALKTINDVLQSNVYKALETGLNSVKWTTLTGGTRLVTDNGSSYTTKFTWGYRPVLTTPVGNYSIFARPWVSEAEEKADINTPTVVAKPATTMPSGLAQVITSITDECLAYETENSAKGYISAVGKIENGDYVHQSWWGPIGNVNRTKGYDTYATETTARLAHKKIVQEKRDKGYYDSSLALLKTPNPIWTAPAQTAEAEGKKASEVVTSATLEPSKTLPIPYTFPVFNSCDRRVARLRIEDESYAMQPIIPGPRCLLTDAGFSPAVTGGLEAHPEFLKPTVEILTKALGVPFFIDCKQYRPETLHLFDYRLNSTVLEPFQSRIKNLWTLEKHLAPAVRIVNTVLTVPEKEDMARQAVVQRWEGIQFLHLEDDNRMQYQCLLWHSAFVRLIRYTGNESTGYTFFMEMYAKGDMFISVGSVTTSPEVAPQVVTVIDTGKPAIAEIQYLYFNGNQLLLPKFIKLAERKTMKDVNTSQLYDEEDRPVTI